MKSLLCKLRGLGPGLLITAAFIGPGTITTASKAGAEFGFALAWSLLFAVVATIVLQEMSARLGLVSRVGLGEAVRETFRHPVLRVPVCGLIVAAIGFGNAAYQTGNITGARVGLESLCGAQFAVKLDIVGPVQADVHQVTINLWPIVLGVAAFVLLISGAYKLIERALIGLVVLMSVVFLVTAMIVRPDIGEMARGTFVPTLPEGSLLTVVGLIGTTVVPYNLFLHASAVREKWPDSVPTEQALGEARLDASLAISLGGLITLAVVATSAATFFGNTALQFKDPGDMARQLEPLLGGSAARILFGVGLLAAGLTSAITAPLAAAYATAGALGWRSDLRSSSFRAVWIVVLLTGTILAAFIDKSPAQIILIAQVANGILLPVIAVFLLVAVNRTSLMGKYKNGVLANVMGGAVVLVATGLAAHTLVKALF